MLEELSAEVRPRHSGQFVLHDDARLLLAAYPWPGNVRELRNTLERAVMLSDSEQIDARTLRSFMGTASFPAPVFVETAAPSAVPHAPHVPYAQAMIEFEKQFLSDALRATGGRVAEAAQHIGIGRATLYKKIAALGIEV
jgi:DNA-binding NtrC family response regulator